MPSPWLSPWLSRATRRTVGGDPARRGLGRQGAVPPLTGNWSGGSNGPGCRAVRPVASPKWTRLVSSSATRPGDRLRRPLRGGPRGHAHHPWPPCDEVGQGSSPGAAPTVRHRGARSRCLRTRARISRRPRRTVVGDHPNLLVGPLVAPISASAGRSAADRGRLERGTDRPARPGCERATSAAKDDGHRGGGTSGPLMARLRGFSVGGRTLRVRGVPTTA